MSEGAAIDECVDFDEENYMEEMDDDVEEEHIDDDDDGVNGNGNESEEEHEYDESAVDSGRKEQLSDIATESVEDEQKPSFVDEEEKQKHEELLALPPHGSEVFIGGLPRDACEDDLRELCEPIGDIFEVRLMKDKDTGEDKGYAFVTFKTKTVAQKAIEGLHNKEIKDPQNPSRNRGFAFVLYYNNACADYSRQKMSSVSFKLDGNTPTVTLADPKNSSDHSASSQVKALYVENIPENTTTEQLKELFSPHGEVIKVVMPPGKAGGKRDFGFIHYAERSSALKAIKDTEKYEIDGQVLEVVLAKPQTEKKSDGGYAHNPGLLPDHIPHPGYGGGFPRNLYNSLGGGYGLATGFQQPVIYGRGPMPAGMQMVPMVLPDGQIGYVLQQPGLQMPAPRLPHRIDRGNGPNGRPGRGGSGGGSDDGNRSKRYRPY